MPSKTKKTVKRYTDEMKKRILTAAREQKLTGAQVKKKFGVAQLTFYRWRGPVRKKTTTAATTTLPTDTRKSLEQQVREQIRAILPSIIHDEVKNALKA